MLTRFPMIRLAAFAVLVALLGPVGAPEAQAQLGRAGSLLRRWARSHGSELAEEGAERSARRLERLLARHGDEFAPVLERVGPKGARLLDSLPADAAPLFRRYGQRAVLVFEHHGDDALRLARTHGDEAVAVLAAHPGAGPRLLDAYGGSAASSLTALSSRSAVRLGKLADAYQDLPPEARRAFLDQLRQGGDDFVAWVWRRKVEIFGSASLAAGVLTLYKVGDGVAEAVPERLPRPAEPPDPATQPVAAWLDRWGLITLLTLGGLGLLALAIRAVRS